MSETSHTTSAFGKIMRGFKEAESYAQGERSGYGIHEIRVPAAGTGETPAEPQPVEQRTPTG